MRFLKSTMACLFFYPIRVYLATKYYKLQLYIFPWETRIKLGMFIGASKRIRNGLIVHKWRISVLNETLIELR